MAITCKGLDHSIFRNGNTSHTLHTNTVFGGPEMLASPKFFSANALGDRPFETLIILISKIDYRFFCCEKPWQRNIRGIFKRLILYCVKIQTEN